MCIKVLDGIFSWKKDVRSIIIDAAVAVVAVSAGGSPFGARERCFGSSQQLSKNR